jgi:hypothetical protein
MLCVKIKLRLQILATLVTAWCLTL